MPSENNLLSTRLVYEVCIQDSQNIHGLLIRTSK